MGRILIRLLSAQYVSVCSLGILHGFVKGMIPSFGCSSYSIRMLEFKLCAVCFCYGSFILVYLNLLVMGYNFVLTRSIYFFNITSICSV